MKARKNYDVFQKNKNKKIMNLDFVREFYRQFLGFGSNKNFLINKKRKMIYDVAFTWKGKKKHIFFDEL